MQTATLGDNARFNLLLFRFLTYVQLTLLLFFAALSAAGTITQEKDRRTFVLLLLTDLRNYEIVLGKLFGSLLQILFFLLGTIPLLALTLLLGGIAPEQVAQAMVVLTSTALAAGSLGGLVALWRDKTFQALALTVLFIVLYWCLVQALAILTVWPGVGSQTVADWQERLDPLAAMLSVLEPPAATPGAVPAAYVYGLAMLVLAVLLNGLAIWRLRVWNPSGEPVIQREQIADEDIKDRARAHAAPGAVRKVWANPIFWREIATRAYGRRPLLVKSAYFIVLALVCYYALAPLLRGRPQEWDAAFGLVPVGILSLLLVSAQAVTAVTSERDLGALDLLLVTDLSPREFIFGKLLGICYNTKEFLLPPLILVVVYATLGRLASPPTFYRNFEAGLYIAAGTVILLAFTMVLGIHVALRNTISRQAVVQTLGTVFFLSVGTLLCIALILINGRFEYQWFSFIFFIAAGIGGFWWVLSGDRPAAALTLASWLCPLAVFYSITNVLVAKPGTHETSDPLIPFLVTGGAFGFAVASMLVPMLSEFDVAMGRTTGGGE
jgi:ABC-type Na+ efflux pump permease subunit